EVGSAMCFGFFFFQAEDGIRDLTVTGVQTCALPIYDLMQGAAPARFALETLKAKTAAVVHDKQAFGQGVAEVFRQSFTKGGGKRSEERRVGKERRARRSPQDTKEEAQAEWVRSASAT